MVPSVDHPSVHHLGAARQKIQDPITEGGVEAQGLQLDDELGGFYVVWNAELLSMNIDNLTYITYSSCPDRIGHCAV